MFDADRSAANFCIECLALWEPGQGNGVHVLVGRMTKSEEKEEAVRGHWPEMFFTQRLWRSLGPGQALLNLIFQRYHSWLLEQLNSNWPKVPTDQLSQPFSPNTSETVLGNAYFNGWLMSCEPQGVISLLITRFSNLTSRSDCSQWQPFYLHNAKLALRNTVNAVMLQLSSALPNSIKLYIFSFTPWGSLL